MTGRPGHWTTEMNGGSSAPYLASTPCVPLLLHYLIRVEAEGLLDYQGRAGIISIVRWNLRPVIFGVEKRRLHVLSQTANPRTTPHEIDDQHRECKILTGCGASLAFFLGSDSLHTTTTPPKKMPSDEEGLLWGLCVVRGPLFENPETLPRLFRDSGPEGPRRLEGATLRGRPTCVGAAKSHLSVGKSSGRVRPREGTISGIFSTGFLGGFSPVDFVPSSPDFLCNSGKKVLQNVENIADFRAEKKSIECFTSLAVMVHPDLLLLVFFGGGGGRENHQKARIFFFLVEPPTSLSNPQNPWERRELTLKTFSTLIN